MTHLAEYFQKRRLDKGLGLGQVARMVGYKNLAKGRRRIETFEACGDIAADLLARLAAALDVDQATLDHLAQEDLREWAAWANEPIRPFRRQLLFP